MSKVLIIGASGFLGRHLMKCCPGAHRVGTYFTKASPGLEFLDLRDRRHIRDVVRRIAPSVVIYAAGLTDVDASERAPYQAWDLNAQAVAEVASCSAARIVYLSTDYVFDGVRGLYCEDDEPRPVNIYGQTKAAGERIVLASSHRNLVVRVSGLYDVEGIRGCTFSKPLLPSIDDDVRLSSPVHVEDVASAIQLLLDSDTGGIYHVAGPDVLSRYEFWQLVSLRYRGGAAQIEKREMFAVRPRDSSLLTRRMQSLGWQARPVCHGLPALNPAPRTAIQTTFQTSLKASKLFEGVLIDCVGGLLTRRTWLPENDMLAEIDSSCGNIVDGPEFWRSTARSFDLDEADIYDLQKQVTFRYAPNPTIWAHLRRWRTQYRLALVNNGTSATFRLWVKKYGLDQVFDVLANSEELGVRKPDAEFFSRVAKELGTRCEHCVLIDDDARNIEGARICGLGTIQTRQFYEHPLSIHGWDHVLASESLFGVDIHE